MNALIELLEEFGFSRNSNLAISKPLIIHAVPGAGKTSLLRKFISLSPNFEVYTFGEEDKGNLSGLFIRKFTGVKDESNFVVIDEYLSGPSVPEADALFSDPFQNLSKFPVAHYTKSESLRVPKAVCLKLNALGFEIHSEVEGSVSIEPFFGKVPVGKTLAYEEEVIKYLRGYRIDVGLPCKVRGLEFDTVTLFVLKEPKTPEERVQFFICATRAKKRLIIRTANVFSSPS